MRKILLSLLLILGLCVPAWAATENLTTWTETDGGAKMTVTTSEASGTWINDDNVSLDKDYTAGTIGQFTHKFAMKYNSGGTGGGANGIFWAVSNSSTGRKGVIDASNVGMYLKGSVGNPTFTLHEESYNSNAGQDSSTYNGSWDTWYYVTCSRDADSTDCYIYQEAGRTTLLATLTLPNYISTTYRYVTAIASGDDGHTSNQAVKDVEIVSNGADCNTDCSMCTSPDVPRACLASSKPCYYLLEGSPPCTSSAATFKTEFK